MILLQPNAQLPFHRPTSALTVSVTLNRTQADCSHFWFRWAFSMKTFLGCATIWSFSTRKDRDAKGDVFTDILQKVKSSAFRIQGILETWRVSRERASLSSLNVDQNIDIVCSRSVYIDYPLVGLVQVFHPLLGHWAEFLDRPWLPLESSFDKLRRRHFEPPESCCIKKYAVWASCSVLREHEETSLWYSTNNPDCMLHDVAVFTRLKVLFQKLVPNNHRSNLGCDEYYPGAIQELSPVPQNLVKRLDETYQAIIDASTAGTGYIDDLADAEAKLTGMFSRCFPSLHNALIPKSWFSHFLQNIYKNITFRIPLFFRAKTSNCCTSGKNFIQKAHRNQKWE